MPMCATPATSRTWSTWSATSATVAGGGVNGMRSRRTGSTSSNLRGSPPRSRTTSSESNHQSAQRWLMNGGTNVTMQTPPFPGSEDSTSSGTLRGCLQTANAELWLKITGAVVTSSASRMTAADTWERSTNMPIRFISATTSRPNGDNPCSTGSSVAESAQGTFSLWVSVM